MKKKKCREWVLVFEEMNEFMEGNLDKWNTIDEIRKTYDKFINNLKKLKDLQPELERDLAPVKEELSDKRDLLFRKLFPVGNILEVYAEDHRIGKKARSLVEGWKKVESIGNTKLLDHAIQLHGLMDKYLNRTANGTGSMEIESGETETTENESPETKPEDSLPVNIGSGMMKSTERTGSGQDIRRYGLTRDMLDELYSANQQYRSSLKLRNDVLRYRRKIRMKRDGLIRANRNLLKNRLDKLISVFSGTHPSFYREYSLISDKKSSGRI